MRIHSSVASYMRAPHSRPYAEDKSGRDASMAPRLRCAWGAAAMRGLCRGTRPARRDRRALSGMQLQAMRVLCAVDVPNPAHVSPSFSCRSGGGAAAASFPSHIYIRFVCTCAGGGEAGCFFYPEDSASAGAADTDQRREAQLHLAVRMSARVPARLSEPGPRARAGYHPAEQGAGGRGAERAELRACCVRHQVCVYIPSLAVCHMPC